LCPQRNARTTRQSSILLKDPFFWPDFALRVGLIEIIRAEPRFIRPHCLWKF